MGIAHPLWHIDVGKSHATTIAPLQAPSPGNEVSETTFAVALAETPAHAGEMPVVSNPNGSQQSVLTANQVSNYPNYSWLAIIWAAGAICCITRFLVGWLRMITLQMSSKPASAETGALSAKLAGLLGIRSNVAVRIHRKVISPMSCGILRPTILLPETYASWTDAETRMVLAHELAHVRRLDSAFIWLTEICRALFWPNPLVWIAVRQTRLADERAADDAVLGNGCDPQDYADLLLTLARKAVGMALPLNAASAMAQPSSVRLRIERILDQGQLRRFPNLVTMAVLGILVGLCAIAIGGGGIAKAQEGDDPPKQESTPQVPETSAIDRSQLMIEKLRTIVLPSIVFEDARLDEAITFLRIKSRELDTETEVTEKGVNFILKGKAEEPTITLSLNNVPLIVALKAITDLAGFRYRVEPHAIVVLPLADDSGDMYTRVFHVSPSFMRDIGVEPRAYAREL